jgi:hypothetical protein
MVELREQRRREQRMVEDGAFILDHSRWPGDRATCHVKTQPWVEPRAFGYINRENKLLVIGKDGAMNEAFDSIAALVERWSVD